MAEQKIIQGDCLEVMRGFPDETFDLVLTSPPYDNLRDYNGYSFDFEGTAREIYRLLKEGGVCVWVVNDSTVNGSETGTSFKQALFFKEIGLNLHDTMIFLKPSPLPQTKVGRRYTSTFEYMFVLSKGKVKTFNPILIPTKTFGKKLYPSTQNSSDGKKRERRLIAQEGKTINKEKQLTNCWTIRTAGLPSTGHPATFPIQLAKDHILSWSNESDTILDPFLGSGTTLLACQELNRNGIGIEISEEYCEIARKRLEQDTLL